MNTSILKLSIPSAVKWTAIADFLVLAAQSLKYIPSTIWGISTLPFVTIAAAAIATWEGYAIRQENAMNTPVQSTPTPTPTPVPPKLKFTLSGLASASVGTNMTLSVSNGLPNGTFAIYEDGVGQAPCNISALTISHILDAKGSGQIAFTPLTAASPIGAILNDSGRIDVYAADSAGNISNTITIKSS